MDVTFFEDMSYFSSSDTALQGENSFFEELYHGEGEESEGGEEAGGILTDPVETISSPPPEAEAPNIQAPVSMAENDVEDTTPNIKAPVSMAENDVEDTIVPPTIASTPDPQLPGTEDHSFEDRLKNKREEHKEKLTLEAPEGIPPESVQVTARDEIPIMAEECGRKGKRVRGLGSFPRMELPTVTSSTAVSSEMNVMQDKSKRKVREPKEEHVSDVTDLSGRETLVRKFASLNNELTILDVRTFKPIHESTASSRNTRSTIPKAKGKGKAAVLMTMLKKFLMNSQGCFADTENIDMNIVVPNSEEDDVFGRDEDGVQNNGDNSETEDLEEDL
ncbi:uncharacterized protein LOC133723150 [Rosa rugosa]|uniref:uncharacterized protein LOC133723150 n=1 Tax=Rosa rugosa TaxID=74645 RepID=UPI002B40946F|nr:uncharacterized protein LOC133723150 [Rosa rugosa]